MQKHLRKEKPSRGEVANRRQVKRRHRAEGGQRSGSSSCDGSALDARMAAPPGRLDRDRQGGRSGSRSDRPAEAYGRRLSGSVRKRQGQAQPPRRHQSVRRHERHQQDVRLEERRRARAQARRGAAQAAEAGDHRAEGRAGSAARHQEAEGRQQMGGADPAHDLRAGAHRRFRHPLHQLRSVRWRHRSRL